MTADAALQILFTQTQQLEKFGRARQDIFTQRHPHRRIFIQIEPTRRTLNF
jgi:hypothetical protein